MAAMLENDVIQKDDVRARNSTGSSVGLIVGGMKFTCAKFHARITKLAIWIKIAVSRYTYFIFPLNVILGSMAQWYRSLRSVQILHVRLAARMFFFFVDIFKCFCFCF